MRGHARLFSLLSEKFVGSLALLPPFFVRSRNTKEQCDLDRARCSSKAPDRVLIPTVNTLRVRKGKQFFDFAVAHTSNYARLAGNRRKCGERAVEVGRCDREPSESSSVFRTLSALPEPVKTTLLGDPV